MAYLHIQLQEQGGGVLRVCKLVAAVQGAYVVVIRQRASEDHLHLAWDMQK